MKNNLCFREMGRMEAEGLDLDSLGSFFNNAEYLGTGAAIFGPVSSVG